MGAIGLGGAKAIAEAASEGVPDSVSRKKRTVVLGWILRKGSSSPELATARPYKGKKDDF